MANGVRTPNLGEKRFDAATEHGSVRQITAQACEANKQLLSVCKLVTAGNRAVFGTESSYVEDVNSGDVVWLKGRGDMYMLKVWLKTGFIGGGRLRKVGCGTRKAGH